MFKINIIFILSICFSISSFAASRAENEAIKLVNGGNYFSAIPFIKTALSRGKLSSKGERAFDTIVTHAGTGQFEILPIKILSRSNSSTAKYLIAKKYLRVNKASKALKYSTSINPNHPVYPFSMNLNSIAYSMLGKTKSSIESFRDCEISSIRRLKKTKSKIERKQLLMNRDYCVMGEARALFSARKYDKANLRYLDIPKSSMVWPEVLFEEAWNSYYLKNYNRTLGKLVTYNAPVFDYIFNPEIDVLNSLTFLKMCLYNDAKKITNNFYSKYMQPARDLRLFLKRKGKNYKYFYRMMVNFESTGKANSKLLKTLLKSITRETSYLEIKNALVKAAKELKSRGSYKSNLSEVIKTQKSILGSYVRSRLIGKYAELYKAFQGMSYIKLEVLAQRKAKLYNFKEGQSKRGDVKYIERNDKQYFWDFNGEFWADELGDYVFALGSEC